MPGLLSMGRCVLLHNAPLADTFLLAFTFWGWNRTLPIHPRKCPFVIYCAESPTWDKEAAGPEGAVRVRARSVQAQCTRPGSQRSGRTRARRRKSWLLRRELHQKGNYSGSFGIDGLHQQIPRVCVLVLMLCIFFLAVPMLVEGNPLNVTWGWLAGAGHTALAAVPVRVA